MKSWSRGPARREYRQSIDLARLAFGLACLVAGTWLLMSPTDLPPPDTFGAWLTWLFELGRHQLAGASLLTLGILTMVSGCQLSLDRDRGIATRHSGFPLPLFTEEIPLAGLTTVVLRHSGVPDSSESWTHTICLEGEGRTVPVIGPEDRLGDELEARRHAEDLSRLLGIDLIDELSYTRIRRKHSELDASLREQLRGKRFRADPPPAPRALMEQDGRRVAFMIPPPPLWTPDTRLALGAAIGITLLLLGLVLPGLVAARPDEFPWLLVTVGLLYVMAMIPLTGTLIEAVRHATGWTRIEVDPAGLRSTRRSLLHSDSVFIPGEELEEVRIEEAGEQVLAAISDRRIVRFGAGLEQDELVWIHDQLLNALTS